MCSAWSCGLRSGGCIGSSVGRSARSTSALVCAAGPFAGRWASEKPLRSRRAPSPSKLDPFRDWVCRQLQAARIARAPLCGYTGPEFQRTLLARSGHSTRNNSSCSEQSRHPETERSAGACFPRPTSISSPSTDGLLCARKAVRRARHPSPGRCLARADERLAEPRLCPRVNPSAGWALARSCPAARLSPRVATRSALLLRLAGGPGADAPIAGR